MGRFVSAISFLILALTLLNYIVYALGYEIFIEELYVGISMILTVVVIIIKRISKIEGVYKGTKDLSLVGNIFVWAAVANVIVSSVVSKDTGDSAYFWFSCTIMMSSLVFLSFYVGKTFSGINWFLIGDPNKENTKGRKTRKRNSGRRGRW